MMAGELVFKDKRVCPLCGMQASRQEDAGGTGAVWYECLGCGRFVIDGTDEQLVLGDHGRLRCEFCPDRLSILTREQTTAGLPPYLIRFPGRGCPCELVPGTTVITAKELLSKWPQSVPERLERALLNLARTKPKPGAAIQGSASDPQLVFALDKHEGRYVLECLAESELVKPVNSSKGLSMVRLTSKGWARVDQMTRSQGSPLSPVFVAMWFGGESQQEEMTDVFIKGIRPAVENAGYRAERVDLVQHNEYIMDKIISMIRQAPFVVADFTGHRNGVYYEAGFAKGLGKAVIHCCRKNELRNAHFDTAQLSFVVWTDPVELMDRLCNRIAGTIGRGPYPC